MSSRALLVSPGTPSSVMTRSTSRTSHTRVNPRRPNFVESMTATLVRPPGSSLGSMGFKDIGGCNTVLNVEAIPGQEQVVESELSEHILSLRPKSGLRSGGAEFRQGTEPTIKIVQQLHGNE